MSDKKRRIDITNLAPDAAEEFSEDDIRKVTGGATSSTFIRIAQPHAAGNEIAVETLTIAHEGFSRD